MHIALALLLLVIFAATSEGAALCLATSSSAIAGSHVCCGERPVSPASLTTCCTMSRPDRDTRPFTAYASGTPPALAAPAALLFARNTTVASAALKPTSARNVASVPLYLQHLSLLI